MKSRYTSFTCVYVYNRKRKEIVNERTARNGGEKPKIFLNEGWSKIVEKSRLESFIVFHTLFFPYVSLYLSPGPFVIFIDFCRHCCTFNTPFPTFEDIYLSTVRKVFGKKPFTSLRWNLFIEWPQFRGLVGGQIN